MKIGNTELKYGLMLAPMAGFSDYSMRKICNMYGAELSVTEMVSAKAVVYGDKKTCRLAKIREDEGPVALQIFGSEPSIMAEAAHRLSFAQEGGASPVAIDINMGCPVPKVYGNGEGSALMKNPELIYSIVKSVSTAIDIPCTVKMRLGIDSFSINASECALAAEEGGAKLLTLHGRTRAELYSGKANYEEIAKVKKCLQIPLVANGDVCSALDAQRILAVTGADGIAIGRGAVGNPFLFSQISAYLDGREPVDYSLDERIKIALLQLSLAISDKGEENAVREARKQIALYFKGFRGAAELRAAINFASTYSEVEAAIRALRS